MPNIVISCCKSTTICVTVIDAVFNQIALNVKKQRKNKGLSQLSLAIAIGHKSVGLISFTEAGINNAHFNVTHLVRIAFVLGITIDVLFCGVDEILHAHL